MVLEHRRPFDHSKPERRYFGGDRGCRRRNIHCGNYRCQRLHLYL
ncbi:MAG: DUF3079 domain-containing protein [Phaeodactylibacter sp.]|nr:DUF3079 domain-containing protein [Phaeodactylibacter sp.]